MRAVRQSGSEKAVVEVISSMAGSDPLAIPNPVSTWHLLARCQTANSREIASHFARSRRGKWSLSVRYSQPPAVPSVYHLRTTIGIADEHPENLRDITCAKAFPEKRVP
jgi:hypothetical protein